MHRSQASDDCIIFDNHVPGKRAVVGQDHMVPQQYVVGDVAVGEDVVV
mgnify:CR=1 FL=1